jgi:hypothetical protein
MEPAILEEPTTDICEPSLPSDRNDKAEPNDMKSSEDKCDPTRL